LSQANEYAKKSAKSQIMANTSKIEKLQCSKSLKMAEKKKNYQNMILQAARKAADIQIRATCSAEKKTVEAHYNASLAKRELEPVGKKTTAIPAIKTIDLKVCKSKY